MIPNLHNWEVYYSIGFYVIAKLLSFLAEYLRLSSMYSSGKPTLTCIPEHEAEDENLTIKWVPKKKHEVLKAKYKCLKKLFQIYDASLIGMFPAGYEEGVAQYSEVPEERKRRRKKRSRRSRTNALVGTSEDSTRGGSEDLVSNQSLTITTEVEINHSDHNLSVVQSARSQTTTKSTQSSKENLSACELVHSRSCQNYQGVENRMESLNPRMRHQRYSPSMPVDMYGRERLRPTRFQIFISRIFGIRRERPLKTYVCNANMYAIPDKNLSHNHGEKRRRRGLRFGRTRSPKTKLHIEPTMTGLNSPVILNYVQSVQKNCLMDTTPRQCPIVGCRMIYYGIINYNDHLNLCHFPERKYICHYCHEGFEYEPDKLIHENEHLGLNKLNFAANIPVITSNNKIARQTNCDIQTESRTNTELSEDKLKKIVSLFDKFVESDQIIEEIKKKRYSDSNIEEKQSNTQTNTTESTGKRTISLTRADKPPSELGVNAKCHVCGESFDNRTQLNLHTSNEHRGHTKFSKFHSCAGIVNVPKNNIDLISRDGQINIESLARSCCMIHSATTLPSKKDKSESNGSLQDLNYTTSCYSTSTLTKKPSAISNIINTMKTSMYRWEPGTKIINV